MNRGVMSLFDLFNLGLGVFTHSCAKLISCDAVSFEEKFEELVWMNTLIYGVGGTIDLEDGGCRMASCWLIS